MDRISDSEGSYDDSEKSERLRGESMKKRILAMALILAMMFALIPAGTEAAISFTISSSTS